MRSWLLALVALSLASACADTAGNPWVTKPVRGVLREVFHVGGVHPADNPDCTTNCATPTTQDVTQVVRYREDSDNPIVVSAIIVAMPGFLAGASTFDGLARTLVRRGRERGVHVEVWAIDRRANLLEDTYGLEEAERRRSPLVAQQYYREGADIGGGRVFQDFIDPVSVPYMSEWGLATHVEDVRRVISLIPQASRKNHVYLMGHSLGGSFVEAYAGWTFENDGTHGVDDLAGLIMIDGILGSTPLTEPQYLNGSNALGFPTPGLTGIRASMPYTALPVLGVSALVNAEIAALYAHFDPNGVVDDPIRDAQFALLFTYADVADVPPITNLTALGLAFDSQHEPLPFVRATVGTINGPTEPFTSLFNASPLDRPSDPAMTYTWTDGPAAPGEFSSATVLASSMVSGRSNLAEWYFPSRLALDLAAVGGGTIPMTGYPSTYGLRVFAGNQIDAPVLCIAAELTGNVAACDAIRSRVAPNLGAGRQYSGFDRGTAGQDVPGFHTLDVTTMAHIDPVLALDHEFNPVPAKIEQMLDQHTSVGGIYVPRQAFPTGD